MSRDSAAIIYKRFIEASDSERELPVTYVRHCLGQGSLIIFLLSEGGPENYKGTVAFSKQHTKA